MVLILEYSFSCIQKLKYHDTLGTEAPKFGGKYFGGRPVFPFGTGDHLRNCVRARIRFPPSCWKARNFSKSYGLYFVIFLSYFPYFPSYFFIFPSYLFVFSTYSFIFLNFSFIFRHISPIFLHFSWAPSIEALGLGKIPTFPSLKRLWDLRKFWALPLYRGFGTSNNFYISSGIWKNFDLSTYIEALRLRRPPSK